jgi:ubiquinone/menaquinone biosynthesis C-methylase UbiE
MAQRIYDSTAAEGYERAFARVSLRFVPSRSRRAASGQVVLDVATGTGLAAAAALANGWTITAADISPHMVEQARAIRRTLTLVTIAIRYLRC